MSPANIREGLWRLRKRNLAVTCSECMKEKVFNGVCENCGFEPDAPVLPLEVMADSQSPTNHIFPGNSLGSDVDYQALRKAGAFTSNEQVVKRWINSTIEDSLLRGVKSDVLELLKSSFPNEKVTDEAGRLCVKETVELLSRYPKLETAKYARAAIVQNVLARLKLLHPQLRNVSLLGDNGHE